MMLASASNDGTLKLLDVRAEKVIYTGKTEYGRKCNLEAH